MVNEAGKKLESLVSMVTGKDNITHDVVRWLTLLGGIAIIVYQGYVTYHTHIFDVGAFAIGFGGFLTGAGMGLKIKETTEPQ